MDTRGISSNLVTTMANRVDTTRANFMEIPVAMGTLGAEEVIAEATTGVRTEIIAVATEVVVMVATSGK